MSWNWGGGRDPFFKLLFPLLQRGQLKQLEERAESTPLPPLPVPPAPTRTPHSPRLGSLPVVSLGLEANCGKKRAQLCPCGPSGRHSLRPVSAGSWTAARPRPSPHSRGAGARTKAQILPELRWLQWMTLHVAPPGHRLEGRVLLPNTQLSRLVREHQGLRGAWHLQTCSWRGQAVKAPRAAATSHWAGSRRLGSSRRPRQDGTKASPRAGGKWGASAGPSPQPSGD